jgi:hypothetical protein
MQASGSLPEPLFLGMTVMVKTGRLSLVGAVFLSSSYHATRNATQRNAK